MKLRSIKGFHDILPDEIKRWQFIEESSKRIFENYGFEEIRIPHLEYTELFTRGIGTTTDVVEKEMYTFSDRDGTSISLRPEGTAGAVRSFIENSLFARSPVTKIYYSGTMFRHERPQKGRYRGFNQIGAEYFGTFSPAADVELISMLWNIFKEIGITDSLVIEINSIGNSETRSEYMAELVKFLAPLHGKLCENCRKKINKNVLRILDCKNRDCSTFTEDAPSILDFLSQSSIEHLEQVKSLLNTLSIPFKINDRIVRGLDYYTETVFEMTTDRLGAQNAVAAGGRYNELVELIGGPATAATGFAIGMERVVMLHKLIHKNWQGKDVRVFIAWIGEKVFNHAFLMAHRLRVENMHVEMETESRSLKSQLKRANKLNSDFTFIFGENEMKEGKVKIRDMTNSTESETPVDDLNAIMKLLT